jgi:hypothetical protein
MNYRATISTNLKFCITFKDRNYYHGHLLASQLTLGHLLASQVTHGHLLASQVTHGHLLASQVTLGHLLALRRKT